MTIQYLLNILFLQAPPLKTTTTTTSNIQFNEHKTKHRAKKNTGENPVWQGSLFTYQLNMFVYKNLFSGLFTSSERISIEN